MYLYSGGFSSRVFQTNSRLKLIERSIFYTIPNGSEELKILMSVVTTTEIHYWHIVHMKLHIIQIE